jgi:hypothetical protein
MSQQTPTRPICGNSILTPAHDSLCAFKGSHYSLQNNIVSTPVTSVTNTVSFLYLSLLSQLCHKQTILVFTSVTCHKCHNSVTTILPLSFYSVTSVTNSITSALCPPTSLIFLSQTLSQILSQTYFLHHLSFFYSYITPVTKSVTNILTRSYAHQF